MLDVDAPALVASEGLAAIERFPALRVDLTPKHREYIEITLEFPLPAAARQAPEQAGEEQG